jgi:hypothetical protein
MFLELGRNGLHGILMLSATSRTNLSYGVFELNCIEFWDGDPIDFILLTQIEEMERAFNHYLESGK